MPVKPELQDAVRRIAEKAYSRSSGPLAYFHSMGVRIAMSSHAGDNRKPPANQASRKE
jgi:hypothetical protein